MNQKTAIDYADNIRGIFQADGLEEETKVSVWPIDGDDKYAVLIWLALPPCNVRKEDLEPTLVLTKKLDIDELEEILLDEGADDQCDQCGAMTTELRLRDGKCYACIYGLDPESLDK